MTIDVVIPFRNSPLTGNAELKYTLRGIDKYLSGVRYVHLYGDFPREFPAYLNNVIGWPHTENNWYQYLTRNIHDKLLAACNNPAVSNPFVYFNDDHFILEPLQADCIPFYHQGKKWDVGTGKYSITIRSTLDLYPDALNFDIHGPMTIDKERYRTAVASLNWKREFGYCIKTAYCEYLPKAQQRYFYPDHKLNRAPTENDFREIQQRKFFSVGDKAMNKDMRAFLHSLYPDKSRYEL